MDRMKDERFMFLLQHYDHTDQWMDEVMDALKADRAHIAELEAQIKELLDKPCSMCGQDERIAQIGKRMGFRPDVGALEIRRLEAQLKAVRNEIADYRDAWAPDQPPSDLRQFLIDLESTLESSK